MLIVIPIRTESSIRRTPIVNYVLITLNVVAYVLFSKGLQIEPLLAIKTQWLAFHADQPSLHQFLSYQFLHAGPMHLLGNMLFLWVFGNSVNAKMGHAPYLMFYVAGGIFAAWGYATVTTDPTHLIGASGAIASVTTAYLVLFPRSRVTVLVWLFIFIHFFELSAMIVIGLKIIVWDNIIAPGLGGPDSVANSAHLAGYAFGFVSALGMLLIRALPRDQFDILALWKRWNLRREFAATQSDPKAGAKARFGSVGRVETADPEQQASEERRLDELDDLRTRLTECLDKQDLQGAAELHEQLIAVDPTQCLSEQRQLDLARAFYGDGRFSEAASAFERFLERYRNSSQTGEIRLLLGIIYARDLRQYEDADKHLTVSMKTLRDDARRSQCAQWLKNVRASLGRPAPELQ